MSRLLSRRAAVACLLLTLATGCEEVESPSAAPAAATSTAPAPKPVTTTRAARPAATTTPPKPRTPSPKPVRATTVPPKAASTCGAPANPWGYNFCGRGSVIHDPPTAFCQVFDCIASFWESTNGYVMQCEDGTFSHSGGRSGSCSHHGGNDRALTG